MLLRTLGELRAPAIQAILPVERPSKWVWKKLNENEWIKWKHSMRLIRLHGESLCSSLLEASCSWELPDYVTALIVNEKQRLCHTKHKIQYNNSSNLKQSSMSECNSKPNTRKLLQYSICMKTLMLRVNIQNDSSTANMPKTPYWFFHGWLHQCW